MRVIKLQFIWEIRVYNTFVHVDTRGSIANWDERT